jgi:hypothetical protein
MANNLEADIWLGYGSFTYGFESTVLEVRANQLVLETKSLSSGTDPSVSTSSTSSAKAAGARSEAKQLFELIEGKSKALLLTEIRIYFAQLHIRRHLLPDGTLHLTSVYAPELQSSGSDSTATSARLMFSDVRPLRPVDTMLWHLLCERIWPELRD